MTEPSDEQRKQLWDRVATGYAAAHDGPSDNQAPATDWMLGRLDVRPGGVVLDLAGGAGAVAHRIALDAPADCRVLSTDFAPEMVATAERVGAELGVRGVEYRELDAERMDLGDDSVDAVICRSALMIMPNPAVAMAEARRVLRPGGRFAFSVFSTSMANPWITVPLGVFVERGLVDPPTPGGPGMFVLGDPDRLRDMLADAGFTDIEIATIDEPYVWTEDDGAWRVFAEVNARTAPVVAAMGDAERAETRAAVIDALERFRADDGALRVPAGILVAAATA